MSAGRHVYLLGIGGSGLSALAGYLLASGDRVSGCDRKDSEILSRLRSRGARVFVGSTPPPLVRESVDVMVHTAAAPAEHPMLVEARSLGIPCFKYAEFLGREAAGHGVIAVAGTHGKTSTSGLLAHLLTEAGLDPRVVVGGAAQGAVLPGRSGVGPFVFEACEYDHSFLSLGPTAAIVTNVEADHLDYFGSEERVIEAFESFLAQVQSPGPVVLHESAARRLDIAKAPQRVVVVGEGVGVTDRLTVLARRGGSWTGRLDLSTGPSLLLEPVQAGQHNLHNAALAASMAVRWGADPAAIEAAVGSFPGMARRLEPLGSYDGVQWYSDYAHHPTELRALARALRDQWPGSRLWVVFQPHQAGRTRQFLREFADELCGFDEVVIPGIFSVREDPSLVRQCESDLLSALVERGRQPVHLDGLDSVLPTLRARAGAGDVVVLAGAGDIDELGRALRAVREEASVARAG